MAHRSAVVLYVNSREANCGVHQFGAHVLAVLRGSTQNEYVAAECAGPSDLAAAVERHRPDVVLYNYHPSTLGWLRVRHTRSFPMPQIGTIHEVTQEVADRADGSLFDHHVAPDPTLLLRNPRVSKTGRLLAELHDPGPPPEIPTIGTFGFATPGKGFERLLTEVQRSFDRAIVRMHVPFAKFGDEDGARARALAERCRGLIDKPGIELRVTHDFLDSEALVRFLGGNSLNAFLYDDAKGRGISSVTDHALAAGRPLAISRSSMFRHLWQREPRIVVGDASLRDVLALGDAPLAPFREEWTADNLRWDYDRIVRAVLAQASAPPRVPWIRGTKAGRTAVGTTVSLGRRSLDVGLRATAPVLARLSGGAALQERARRVGTRWLGRVEALASTQAASSDWVPHESTTLEPPRAGFLPPYEPKWERSRPLNAVLEDEARRFYRPAVEYLKRAAPDVFAKKIERANVQQAFVLDTVTRLASQSPGARLLSVGSYEDTASLALLAGGFSVFELDPVINYDVVTFATKPNAGLGTYDVVFSTSVIEHVVDDEGFARACAALLRPGGYAVFTCDFREDYRPGDPLPVQDRRFYTSRDLRERIPGVMEGCALVDEPRWAEAIPDFDFGGCRYSFATFVVRKEQRPSGG